MRPSTRSTSLFVSFCVAAGSALADGGGGGGGGGGPGDKPLDLEDKLYLDAVARKDWGAAAAAMRTGIARDPLNADFHNQYAYALRVGPKPDMSLVFKHYNEALRLDATHRGAHEYLGEAYLMVGNLPKAKEHLVRLDKLCFLGCTEHANLKKAIAAYESKSAKR